MNDKDIIFGDYMSYKKKDKYINFPNWILSGREDSDSDYKFGYDFDYFSDTSGSITSKREETPQEREARLLREKAAIREAKIDKLLSDENS